MPTKHLGWLAALAAALTTLWLVVFLWGAVIARRPDTFDGALGALDRQGLLAPLGYANAALVTLAVTALYAGLALYHQPRAPVWTALGRVFVPVYCAFNLVVYVSQLTVVPRLLAEYANPATRAAAGAILRVVLQSWPGSAASVFNSLAYALLGLPSLVHGLLLWRFETRPALRLGGLLLALNGLACLAGGLGAVIGHQLLSLGVIAGGVFFLAGLLPLAWTWIRFHLPPSRA
jgi:hypothetical protein